jgi:hypothetical protein
MEHCSALQRVKWSGWRHIKAYIVAMSQPIFKSALRLLFAIFLVGTGASALYGLYFSGHEMATLEGPGGLFLSAVLATKWLFPWIATFKLVTGILIAVPRTQKLGVLMALPYAVNIFLWVSFTQTADFAMGAVVLLINVLLLRNNWDAYKSILA